jgi:hypothetical protein
VTTHPARRAWQALEPLHDVVYFAPAVRDAGVALGLKGFWDTYFAFRAAPLGPTDAGTVVATFANFAPGMVARAVPGAWTRTTPEACLLARAEVSAAALRVAGADDDAFSRAADLLAPLVETGDSTGRPLFAANALVTLPADPVARLCQLATTLREHRGDGHVALLVAHGLSGLHAHVLQSARGRFTADEITAVRGWTPQEWSAAVDALGARGLVTDGALTGAAESPLDEIEQATDELSWAGALAPLSEDGLETLVTVLAPAVRGVWAQGWLPAHNPTGLVQEG